MTFDSAHNVTFPYHRVRAWGAVCGRVRECTQIITIIYGRFTRTFYGARPLQCQFNWEFVTWNFHLCFGLGLVDGWTSWNVTRLDEGSAFEHEKALLAEAEIN